MTPLTPEDVSLLVVILVAVAGGILAARLVCLTARTAWSLLRDTGRDL